MKMIFKKWVQDADNEIQDAVTKDVDKIFSTNKRKESLLIPYLHYRTIKTTWYLVIATWFLVLATIALVVFR